MADMLVHLESEGLVASRKTISRDIEELITSDVDVVCNPGKPHQYFVGDRHFELPEVKLLVDAVRASRFIPQRKADVLISKLTSLVSYYQAQEMHRSLYTDKLARSSGYKAYITVDLLHTAVSKKKKITCKYFEWGADKKKEYKHRRQDYFISPYGLVWNNDRYYVVGWSDSHKRIITLRVDRIAMPKLIDEPAVPKPNGFDMAFYAENVIQMYDGPLREVTLSCENEMMKHVIDRFGEDVSTEIEDTDHFIAHVSISASPTFFAWVFTFCGKIRIISPDDVAKTYREMANTALR